MIQDYGTVRPGTTLYIPFHTFDSNDPSASVTLTGLATTDIEIYKDGGTTQRASDAGYALLDTDGIDFDGITGIHGISVNLADNTTAGFYAAGSQYWIVISSITVDAATINFILATFRIGYEDAVINTTIATLASQTSFTLTSGPAEDDALNGQWCIIHDVASAVQLGKALILDYTGSTKTVTLAAGTTFTAAATDSISIMGMAPLQPTTLGRTLDVSAGGEAGLDWANIGSPTTAQNLSGTNIDVDQVVASVTGSIGSVATGGITAGSIAADAIGASELAADAVTEIQSGLATAANLATVAGYIDTEVAAIKTVVDAIEVDTQDIQTRVPAALIGGRMDSSVEAFAGGVITDAAFATNAITDTAVDATVSVEIADAVGAVGPVQDILNRVKGISPVNGTIGSTGNTTTALHLSGLAYADDAINSMMLVIQDVSTGLFYSRWIEDWANTGDLATVATLPFTPQASTDLYWILPFRSDVTGGSGLDAAGVRAALGMSAANMDTQLDALPTNAELATALGTADDAVLASIATLQTYVDTEVAAILAAVDTEIAAIKAKTDNLPTDPADASDIAASFASIASTLSTLSAYVDTEVAAIKAKTDSLTFTVANVLDANIQRVNDVAVAGTGASGDEWGPA